ncbi:MAG: NAD kinase [Lutibacter sp.]|uniref:NAD kinase n=1 Tax=Lutibacter sp. TaxID=1925666 RepID=UPI00299E26C9|nr:NAD kinase [Lutibacter sp.]MDX1828701.1 NAD kinase [Lutibacter sp.]
MKVAIYGQFFKSEDIVYIKELFNILTKKNVEFLVEENYFNFIKKNIRTKNIATFSSYNDLKNSFDFIITMGGDGTILSAVTIVRDSNIPIIGINTGRLGFLATVQKEEIESAINALINKDFLIKERTLLSVSTSSNQKDLLPLNFALNEVSVSRKNTASMIIIETYLDNEYLNAYWADGLIISTPTGSTGYSLSCGGPIITPQAKSFALTPIAPHNLNARPLVIPDETNIKFTVKGRENEFLLSLDSRVTTINSNTEIFVEKAPFNLKMVQINKQTFIKTLREKLLWGKDLRN